MDLLWDALQEVMLALTFKPSTLFFYPASDERYCVDIFFIGISNAFALVTALLAGVYALLDFGVALSPYHVVVASLSLALLIWQRVGDWAMGERRQFFGRPVETYVFLVGQWWLAVALMWAGLAAYDQIRHGKQFLDDNWFTLQTQAIPFTTQLDCKTSFESRSTQIMAFAIVTSVLSLIMATEAWRTLGGGLNLVQHRFRVEFIEFVPLVVVGGGTIAYAVYAAEIGQFATPYTTASLLWVTAMAGLAIIVVGMAVVAIAVWGSCFASHALVALLLPVPSLVMFSTGLWVLERAKEVDGFVQSHWDTIRLYVPPPYSGLTWDNYAGAAATPMLQASTLAILMSVLTLFSSLYHAWAAVVMQSVGSELKESMDSYVTEQEQLVATAMGVQLQQGGDYGSVGGELKSTFLKQPRSGALASPSKSYGTAKSGSRYAALGVDSSDVEDMYDLPGSTDPTSSSSASSSLPSGEALFNVDLNSSSLDTTKGVNNELMGRIQAVKSLKQLPTMYATLLEQYGASVALPSSPTVFLGLLKHDLMQLWGSHQVCLFMTLLAAACCLAGLIGSLAKVTVDGYCSELVANSVGAKTFNFTTTLPLWFGDGPPGPLAVPRDPVRVNIVHNYPLGSVEVVNAGLDTINPFSGNLLTVQAIYFGVSSGDLPSYQQANSTISLGGFHVEDEGAGYDLVSIVLNPPPKAASKCLGVRLIVHMSQWFIQLNVTASSAAVSVTGNLPELSQENNFVPSYYSVNVATRKAPVLVTDVYADWRAYTDLKHPFIGVSFPPSVYASSDSGKVTLSSVFSAGAYAYGGGGVRFANVASVCISLLEITAKPTSPPLCGELVGIAGGNSPMGVSNLLAGRQASFSSDAGSVLLVNVAALIGGSMTVNSNSGPVYLNNMIQGAGNETTVVTRGKVSASACFANRLVVNTLGGGAVGLAVVYAGINSSTPLNFDLGGTTLALTVSELFTPTPGNYSLPLVAVNTDYGDVSILGMGGNPQSSIFADYLSLDVRSVDGSIKVELNGGGINANYSVSSGLASAVVEIDGQPSSLTGHIGGDGSGLNYIFVRSEKDLVQLSRESIKSRLRAFLFFHTPVPAFPQPIALTPHP